jgi:hypothetical protein
MKKYVIFDPIAKSLREVSMSEEEAKKYLEYADKVSAKLNEKENKGEEYK